MRDRGHRELRAAQIAYTRRGWATIELRPAFPPTITATDDDRRRATRPLVRAWPDLAIDPHYSLDDRIERIERLRAAYPALGIGLVMGPQLDRARYHVAIDEDEPGALAALATRLGEAVTPTWRQAARRGHHHVYSLSSRQAFLVDALHGRGGALHVRLDGIDVLGARRYIVAAPSTHRDGVTRYAVIDDRDPAELPEWLWRAIVAAATPARASRHDVDPDLDDAEIERRWPYAARLYRARRLAAAAPPAIQGQRGWSTTMRLVGAIVTGLAIARDDAIEIVAEQYSPRCVPPWSTIEIEYMVDRALQMPYRSRGWLLASSTTSMATTSASATASATASASAMASASRGGQSGGAAALPALAPPTLSLARAEIVGVDERPGRGAVWFAILDGPRAGQIRQRPMDWPPTDRSREPWAALARAIGADAITQPHAQLWRRIVRVEIVDDPTGAYSWRLGRVYPIDPPAPPGETPCPVDPVVPRPSTSTMSP